MFGAKKGPVAMTLLACLAAPLMTFATPDDHDRDDRGRERRYYDREHRDYHAWDAREDASYRRWRAERHEKYVEYERLMLLALAPRASGRAISVATSSRVTRKS
jgi:hypothetical protein